MLDHPIQSHTHTYTNALIYGFRTSSPRMLTNCLYSSVCASPVGVVCETNREKFFPARVYIFCFDSHADPYCAASAASGVEEVVVVDIYRAINIRRRCVCVCLCNTHIHIIYMNGAAAYISENIIVHAKK
jgi:hypothetical protein